MATLGSPRSPTSPLHSRKSFFRRLERCCCTTFAYFPLLFVYGLTTWAVWVEVNVSFLDGSSVFAYIKAGLGVLLWGMLNVSYSIAVFTTPGSPLDPRQDWSLETNRWRNPASGTNRGTNRGRYSELPTYEPETGVEELPEGMTSVTAKSSTGKSRYCKKCRCLKPDRSHHCSSCGRCVLKMDHHCPWLATCVGLHNYKPFLLFLVDTSLFCWLCFFVSGTWVWAAILDDERMREGIRVVNTILLAVLGGIIGLVLSGFTGWHIYLAVTGQTTIESLEKTRYLSPLKKSMEQQFRNTAHRQYVGHEEEGGSGGQEQSLLEHLKETHANALPGVLRPEEGEDSHSHTPSPQPPFHRGNNSQSTYSSSPAKDSLQRSFASVEAQRERDRYSSYLDEQDSDKLPNAFDLGWKRNLQHVFGRKPLLWGLPVCNTSSDGWAWEVSPKWTEAHAQQTREREARAREQAVWEAEASATLQPPPQRRDYHWSPGQGFVDRQQNGMNGDLRSMQMLPLDRRKGAEAADDYDTSSDEDVQPLRNFDNGRKGWNVGSGATGGEATANRENGTDNWNDIPEDFLRPGSRDGAKASRSRSRGRRKGD